MYYNVIQLDSNDVSNKTSTPSPTRLIRHIGFIQIQGSARLHSDILIIKEDGDQISRSFLEIDILTKRMPM